MYHVKVRASLPVAPETLRLRCGVHRMLVACAALLALALGACAWMLRDEHHRANRRLVPVARVGEAADVVVPATLPTKLGKSGPPTLPTASAPSVPPAKAPRQAPKPPFAHILRQTRAEKHLLYDAEEIAVAACMRSRGFEYTPTPYLDDSDLAAPFSRPESGDIEAASYRGYGIADGIETGDVPLPPSANQPQIERMTSERRQHWQDALRGKDHASPSPQEVTEDPSRGVVSVPSGPTITWDRNSCLTVAQRQLYGDDHKYMRLSLQTNLATNQVRRRAKSDEEYLAGVERWRECMARHGLSYARPGSAADELSREYHEGKLNLAGLRQREVDVATADAACFETVGLAEIRESAQSRAEQQVGKELEQVLDDYRQMKLEALQRARQWAPSSAAQNE